MTRCDYCGGKLGLIVHRKWRLRFCKLACKNYYQFRQRQQIRHRRRRPDTSTLMSAPRAVLHLQQRIGYGLLPVNLFCNSFEACLVPFVTHS
jgi:hypothetical protein